jgi:hypothetical protein
MTILAADSGAVPWAALLPIVLLAVGFVIYCLVDVARSRVKYLPKWAWALICLFSVPVGGIIYLIVGRDHGDGGS